MAAAGAYMLILELAQPRRVRVGRLGTFAFAPGQYAYVGSAMNGLEARLRRHLRAEKRKRWHIDYLLDVAAVTMVLAVPGGRDLECELNRRLARHTDSRQPVPKFGASDCRCRSHLHHWPLPLAGSRLAEMLVADVVEAG